MITAVDSNVLIDVLGADPTFGPASIAALREASRRGGLIVSEVVWAETAGWYASEDEAAQVLDDLRVRFVPTGAPAAHAAGVAWATYRRGGGKRGRMIADFLVGAHARAHAERLLTRDYGFYRSCFRGLAILDPTAD
jgi:predicted nucleic acid-binding protein